MRSVAFDLPGLPVDTHVGRLSRRLKLTNEDDPVKVEMDLNGLIPPEERGRFSLRLILHGRQVCFARTPACGRCVLVDICPSADPAAKAEAKAAASRDEELADQCAGAGESASGADQRPLGLFELGRDQAVVAVAVAIAHRDDPCSELLELGFEARQLGEVRRRSHGPSLR